MAIDYHEYLKDLNTTFPNEIDNIDKMQDLTISTKKKADKYYELINANNITGANEYLAKNENADLRLSVFNAEKFNNLRDMILAVQVFFKYEVGVYLGQVVDDKESIDGGAY